VLLKTRGTNDAIAYWNEFIETDDRRFDEIAHAYEQMLAILDASSEDDAHERKIQLLEEFIAKYPDDSAEQILQARLTLGYLIMSKGMNMDGDVNLGGIMTMERVKMLAENYKANAEKAEIVFQESLALADKVGKPHFVKAFNEALANVANAKNPECPEKLNEVDWIPPKNNKIFIAFLTIANVIFILIVLYSLRERIMRLVNRCFHKP
jgi:tetratricopeptide (TPR) repeat protein